MILVLYGADALAQRRRLQALRDEADGGSGMLATNVSTIDGRTAKPADIIGPAMSPPFLAPYRLVIVEGLIDRFESRGEPGGAREKDATEAFNPFFTALEGGMPPTTMLVFTGGGASGRNPMLVKLRALPGAAVEEYGLLKGEELLRFIRGEAQARGIRFRNGPFKRNQPEDEDIARMGDPAAVLALLLQSDTLAIVNELDKLALLTLGREATVDDVVESCGKAREWGEFVFQDAVLDGDLRKALATLPQLWQDFETSQPILGSLFAAYRPLTTVLDLLDDGATPEEVGKAINRPWPGLRDRAIRRARALGHGGVRRAFEILLGADRRHKAGEVDEIVALEVAITELCALVRPIGAGRAR